jgi:hypothetical protein
MLRKYLKDSLHWLHLFCFKLRTFEREADKLTRWQALAIFFKVYPWLLLVGVVLLGASGLASELAGYDFQWQRALTEFAKGGLGGGLGGGLVTWLTDGQVEAIRFATGYLPVMLISFALVYGRPYYWSFYLTQLWRAYQSKNWLGRFRHSPVHWDETIGAPLPWLSDWLFEIAKADRNEGLREVLWVAAERPFQRKAAQKALLKLAVYDLMQFHSVTELRQVATALDFLPEEESFILTEDGQPIVTEDGQSLVTEASNFGPDGLSLARPHLSQIAEQASDYLKRQTPAGQHKALLELQQSVNRFAKAMALAPAPTGPELQRVAAQWSQFINAAETELRARLPFENPFKIGNPLKEHEEDLFKGRRDLIVKLEEAIFTNRPSLLLYGRRRTGKTSTLLNLPRLMSSQFVPVFIDCQNQRFADSDAMFCYHLARALYDELVKRKLTDGLAQPNKNEFAEHAFTRLDEWLDELEAHSQRIGKQILLTFDEYERLEEGLRDGKLTRAVLNQIRAIVQHRERLLVLFSGSHRFEELQTVNWSDYLINVQTLHLSFLTRDEARELIEHPTPEFALGYAPGVVERVLDLTHGQPYLVQALGSELVNLINRDQRKEAMLADLDVAIERVLGMAAAYFENNWRDCNEHEQAALREMVTGQADELSAAERQRALLGLSRKELVEQRDGQWQFTVELFRLWVQREKTVTSVVLSAA